MSHFVQKLVHRNLDNAALKFVRAFCKKVENSVQNERPVYSAENPVSTRNEKSLVNPEFFQDDPVQSYTNIEFTATNPEIQLESPVTLSERPQYSDENPATVDNPPTTCCMSGCSNCVYIIWAEALSKQMATVDPEVAKKILEKIEDPSMKSFLEMELRNLGIMK